MHAQSKTRRETTGDVQEETLDYQSILGNSFPQRMANQESFKGHHITEQNTVVVDSRGQPGNAANFS